MKEKEEVEENEEEEQPMCVTVAVHFLIIKLRPSQSKFYE